MEYLIYLRCFFIGILASASLGPIFILTFNRGALDGFFRGFATALGSCIADGVYFFLALIGVLSLLESSQRFMFWLDTIGGVILIIFGIYSIKKSFSGVQPFILEGRLGIALIISKSFVLTILNPLVLIFFMFVGVQILPRGVTSLPLQQVAIGSLMVTFGSLVVLSIIALIASFVGKAISQKKLRAVSFATGVVFILVGIFFLDHIFLQLFQVKFDFFNLTKYLNI